MTDAQQGAQRRIIVKLSSTHARGFSMRLCQARQSVLVLCWMHRKAGPANTLRGPHLAALFTRTSSRVHSCSARCMAANTCAWMDIFITQGWPPTSR